MITDGFPARRLEVLHNGIDPGPDPGAASADLRQAARRRLELPEQSFVAGTIARFDPVKDLPTLIEAFGTISSGRADARLVLVGDGPRPGELAAAAREAGVGERVVFTGLRDDARALLPAFDVYCNSSLTEGISVTILEAMAAALPVVATGVGGTPEVVVDGGTGRLVPPRDPAALGSAIGALAARPALAAEMGRAGRRRVESAFSLDRMLASYLEAYGPPGAQLLAAPAER
jgi:glycosyltransferase involved in cell wall biosynthesis